LYLFSFKGILYETESSRDRGDSDPQFNRKGGSGKNRTGGIALISISSSDLTQGEMSEEM
jgi:hypothetical protein